MVTSCAAYNCSSRHKKNCGVSFYSFPRNPELRKKWIIATKRKNFDPPPSSRLCSKHFTQDEYQVRPNCNYQLLKPDAVPTVFDFPSHLSKPTPKKRRTLVGRQNHEKQTPNRTQNSLHLPGTHSLPASSIIHNSSQIELEEEKTPAVEPCKNECAANIYPEKNLAPSTPTKTLLRRKIKILQQRLKRRDARITSMRELITVLKKECNAPEILLNIVQNNFSGFPLHVILNTIRNKHISKHKVVYSEKMKEFAFTLYFYSPKAYNFLKKMNFLLPNPSTLRRWISTFQCSPGFLEEVFLFLNKNVHSKPHFKHVNLVFDSMSIRKQIIYDHNEGKNYGYITLGNNIQIDSHETLASEALVFQVVSLRGNFKCVVGYFFIDKINSQVLSKLIKLCIVKLNDSGIRVQNVTCDGTSSNISALKNLGCSFPEKPFFYINNNSKQRQICVMLDACHMLKLARNTLADIGKIHSEKGEVSFKYIYLLHDLQEKESVKFANKLSDKHIFYFNRKMNVKIAAQTLSAGVADALQFLLDRKDPAFVGAEATIEFIRILDKLFDFLNSRDPFGKYLKRPIKKCNVHEDNKMLDDSLKYIRNLQVGGIPILEHPRKTFALGFIININSIKILSNRLMDDLKFKYILTYKFSQDHLELLFSCIRSRGGNNNNPNVKQFQWALRKLMFRNSVQASDNSNCLNFNEVHQSCIMSFAKADQLSLIDSSDKMELENLKSLISNNSTSYYKNNILYYICGFIVKKVSYKIDCKECRVILIENNDNVDLSPYTHFTDYVSRGKLIRASSDVMKVVKFLYKILKVFEIKGNELNTKYMITLACREFAGNIFQNHTNNNDYSEDSHEIFLVKLIANYFYKIMCFHSSKEKTSKAVLTNLGIRQKFNKLVLFKNM